MKMIQRILMGILGACIGIVCTVSITLLWPAKAPAQVQQCTSYKKFYNSTCSFCRIVAQQDPAVILYEDDCVMAVEKRPVRNPVNCLIIPKKHIINIKGINTADQYDTFIVNRMIFVAQLLSKRLNGDGDFKININNGSSAGQTVPHLHMHFVTNNQWRN